MKLTLPQLEMLLKFIKNESGALKNHICSAVERPDHWKDHLSAANMVAQLREVEVVFAKVNGAILRLKGIL